MKVYWTDVYGEKHEVVVLEIIKCDHCGDETLIVQATYQGEPVKNSRFKLPRRTVLTEAEMIKSKMGYKIN